MQTWALVMFAAVMIFCTAVSSADSTVSSGTRAFRWAVLLASAVSAVAIIKILEVVREISENANLPV